MVRSAHGGLQKQQTPPKNSNSPKQHPVLLHGEPNWESVPPSKTGLFYWPARKQTSHPLTLVNKKFLVFSVVDQKKKHVITPPWVTRPSQHFRKRNYRYYRPEPTNTPGRGWPPDNDLGDWLSQYMTTSSLQSFISVNTLIICRLKQRRFVVWFLFLRKKRTFNSCWNSVFQCMEETLVNIGRCKAVQHMWGLLRPGFRASADPLLCKSWGVHRSRASAQAKDTGTKPCFRALTFAEWVNLGTATSCGFKRKWKLTKWRQLLSKTPIVTETDNKSLLTFCLGICACSVQIYLCCTGCKWHVKDLLPPFQGSLSVFWFVLFNCDFPVITFWKKWSIPHVSKGEKGKGLFHRGKNNLSEHF